MRAQIVEALRRIGPRAGYEVSVLNGDIPVKFIKEFAAEYGFQIGEGIRIHDLRSLYESDVQVRMYLVTGLDNSYLTKAVKDIEKDYPDISKKIKFISTKDFRNSIESGLSKEIFGTMTYASVPRPNTKYSGSMPDIEIKTGLVITKMGVDNGYHVRNPGEGRYVWYMSDNTTIVLEAIVGSGFRFVNIKHLNRSLARKKMYICTRLYGPTYKEAADRVIALFPETLVELMSVAEVESTKDLRARLEKSILTDLKTVEKVKSIINPGIWGWSDS